ncbi:DUF3613 domain-containing protein [Bordetella parapertussis]|uniref:Exported protein n=3 Tax=Bordetella parapertussis TaxID=519 RepID=Q7W7X7_BORPA|nr:DUF3613 domain-containing protein [Bordetella parapertussis]AOB39481.1 TapA domain-containing protein [Bordetella parapertussis]AUL43484.1 TapA domain-containing protein [Bordetella parapertussis]AWP63001.1 TapA domain-containing protein [Bordetella parapertussis]AWP70499.1 TapA domain-containing protein [Bordetella parapertussis]AWP89488.1 TapA domain-containing protein [Bordetella parapertussis]
MTTHDLPRFLLCAALAGLAAGAAAQTHPPLTAAPAAPAPASASPAPAAERPVVRQVAAPAAPAAAAPAPDDGAVGAVTRGLLAAQADGRRAGPGLPLQGPVASAAWQRYLESFSQPVPQWFGERIEDNVGGSGGGGG